MIKLLFLCLLSTSYGALLYDTYHAKNIGKEELKRFDKTNSTFWCTIQIEPCDPNEGRRFDGSCNNLENPIRGAIHTPFRRLLPPVFDKVDNPRKSKLGNDLPLARRLRTSLLSVGRVSSQTFTQLAIHYIVYMSADIVSQHDTRLFPGAKKKQTIEIIRIYPTNYLIVQYIEWKPYCCAPKGKTDRECVPNKIPHDDPVHRFSGISCLNMTRPMSFQSKFCIKNNTAPERIISTTPLLDQSPIYGASEKIISQKSRKNVGGLLKFDVENGKIWPPTSKSTKGNVCYLNQLPHETRCHDTPDDGVNTLAGINMVSMWFWRLHNFIATELAKVNPCWDDNKLFYTARDINIAIEIQIYLYELLPPLIGAENLKDSGVTEPTLGFRDIYNSSVLPQMSLEYPYVLRWLHTMQEGALKMYDVDGNYLKQFPVTNLTLRTGFFAAEDNFVYITQGAFRQGSAKADYIVDPDIAELGLGPHQRVSDLTTNDMAKSRYFGFQPYIKYREFCFGKPVKSYEDLVDVIDPERIEILKEMYEDIEDIDLMAGIWVEKLIPGGHAPSTFSCLVMEQMIRNIVSDRHWYERPNRPNAFTLDQLKEIRKATIARLLCDVGDSVTKIQPQAFLRIGPGNKLTSCEDLTKIDYSAWKDPKCENNV